MAKSGESQSPVPLRRPCETSTADRHPVAAIRMHLDSPQDRHGVSSAQHLFQNQKQVALESDGHTRTRSNGIAASTQADSRDSSITLTQSPTVLTGPVSVPWSKWTTTNAPSGRRWTPRVTEKRPNTSGYGRPLSRTSSIAASGSAVPPLRRAAGTSKRSSSRPVVSATIRYGSGSSPTSATCRPTSRTASRGRSRRLDQSPNTRRGAQGRDGPRSRRPSSGGSRSG